MSRSVDPASEAAIAIERQRCLKVVHYYLRSVVEDKERRLLNNLLTDIRTGYDPA